MTSACCFLLQLSIFPLLLLSNQSNLCSSHIDETYLNSNFVTSSYTIIEAFIGRFFNQSFFLFHVDRTNSPYLAIPED